MGIQSTTSLILLSATLLTSYPSWGHTNCPPDSDDNIEEVRDLTQKLDENTRLQIPENARKMFDGLDQLALCPKKLWPSEDNINYPIILIDPKSDTHWMRKADGQLTPLTSQDLKSAQGDTKGHFGRVELNGESALYMNLGGIQQRTAATPEDKKLAAGIDYTLHEGFHQIHQRTSKWEQKMPKTVSSRSRFAVDWPLTCTPEGPFGARFVRAEILNSLLSAVKSSTDKEMNQHLATARYWSDKHKKQYPNDANDLTQLMDRLEGSAELVGRTANLLIRKPALCQASHSDYIKALTEDVSPNDSSMSFKTDAATESYAIGHLSGILLMKKGGADWTKAVGKNQTPLDILLKNQKPKSAPFSNQLTEKCNKALAPVAQFFGPRVEETLKDWDNPDMIAISVPGTSNGGMNPGFVFAGTKGELELHLGYEGRFGTNDRYNLKEQNLFKGKDACGNNRGILLVPKSTLQAGAVKYQNKIEPKNSHMGYPPPQEISIDGAVTASRQFLGKTLHCLQD